MPGQCICYLWVILFINMVLFPQFVSAKPDERHAQAHLASDFAPPPNCITDITPPPSLTSDFVLCLAALFLSLFPLTPPLTQFPLWLHGELRSSLGSHCLRVRCYRHFQIHEVQSMFSCSTSETDYELVKRRQLAPFRCETLPYLRDPLRDVLWITL